MAFCTPFSRMNGVPSTSPPLHIEDLQAVTRTVGIVSGDAVEPGDLPPAFMVAVDLPGYEAELPVGAFNYIAITPLALPFHGVIELAFSLTV
ncbi:MAG: hypothetical protein OXC82_04250 [Rhodobacteraceae bacterium]|nr:hypothetical protein [Paracoccaceae bacterium]